jgi:ABC-type polysaccharide/polyol phosphate transport system ATPase subunit
LKRSLISVATGGRISNQGNTLEVEALCNISFELRTGDRLGLVGHNGSGKSTLLRVLAGIYKPQFGSLVVNGKVTSILDVALGMDPEATGYENIYLRGLLSGLSSSEIRAMVPDIEEFTELGNFLRMPVKTYSSGMTLRLAFGLSTALAPEILLIDEVIGTGDASFMEKAHNRIQHFINKSSILVLTSHNPKVIEQFCNKSIWLEHGQVKWSGSIEEFKSVNAT